MFIFNVIPPLITDYNFHDCLMFFLFNIMTYSVFIAFVAIKTIISKPLIDIKADIADDHNLRETVISRSKLIAKNSFLWFFLCCLPFIVYELSNKDILTQVSPITIFIIANGVLSVCCILVLSTILLLYYENMFWILIVIFGMIFTSFISIAPKTELNFLFLFSVIIIIAYCSSYILIYIKKKQI